MTKRAALLIALASATGCRSCTSADSGPTADAGGTITITPTTTRDGSAEDTRTDLVRQDCSGIEPKVEGCSEAQRPSDLLLRFSEKLTELPARHEPPPPTFWDGGRTALAEAAASDLASLGYSERVHVQNAALHLAIAADGANATELERSAIDLVRKLAFDAKDRRAVDPPLQIETWLGPPAAWTERSKATPMFHEAVVHQTRLIRIVRLPTMHANFTQLLAVDTDGRAFLTPVVGSIEIRRGEQNTSPACVGITSPERLRCNVVAGLAGVRNVEELPRNHFFSRAKDGRLPCNGCHTAAAEDDGMLLGMGNVAAGATSAELTREALLVESVGRVLTKLWR